MAKRDKEQVKRKREAASEAGPAAEKGEVRDAENGRPEAPAGPARLRLRYEREIVDTLMRELKISNRWRVPRLQKIVINMGLGEARDNAKLLESAVEEISIITGQKPVVTRARKAISNFKLRRGMPIGAMVTLRRDRMYEFFDRLVNVALPRVRDFRGVSDKSFDGRGDYSLGIREHTIFPELNLDRVERIKGLTVSFVTSAQTDYEAYVLLRELGMPFRNLAGRKPGATEVEQESGSDG